MASRDYTSVPIEGGHLVPSPAQHHVSTYLALALALVTIACVVITVGIGFGVSNNSIKDEIDKVGTSNVQLPASYGVPYYAITPVKDQGSRGTCWAFATIGLLESQYRKNGYEKGFLDEDEYVSFSEQAYALGVVDYCTGEGKDSPYCFGGPPENETSDGEIEWLWYLRDTAIAQVLPTAICPYQSTDSGQYNCPGRDDALNDNPLSFTVKSIKTVYTIQAIKSLLYEKQIPIGWSHAVFERTYTVACNDPNSYLSGTSQCQNCAHPCSYGCCAELIIPGYTQEGVFQLDHQPYAAGGHAMLLVGWNDELRVDQGVFGELDEHTTGGFILKNSWNSAMGHTVGYWMQEHSQLEEDLICPLVKSSRKWLTANATCMLANPDPIACAPGAEKHAGNVTLEGATVLKCSDKALTYLGAQLGWSGCQSGHYYVLASVPYVKDYKYQPSGAWVEYPSYSNGVLYFYFVGWNPATNETYLVTTNATTWYGIENLFTPVATVANDPRCGFFFWPYQTLLEGNVAYPPGGHDTPSVSAIDVQWDDSSYLANKVSSKDYTLIEDSTGSSPEITFTGPFDFDWNN